MTQKLPVSRIVAVAVNLAPRAAQAQDLQTLLILGSSAVIDVVERIRTYDTIDEVAADFGTELPEYLQAVLWFEQAPQPFQVKIGRWAATPTQGLLVGAVLSANARALATWLAISNGGFIVTVNGGAPQNLADLDFGAITNLNGVADVINGVLVGAVCSYDSNNDRFSFQSNAVGDGSTVSFLTAGGGTDISALLGGLVDSGGYVADGIVAESAVAAATLFDQRYGQTWYGLHIGEAVDADHLAVAAYIEAANNKHLYFVSTQEAGVVSSVSTTDIAYLLAALRYKRSPVQYSSENAYAACSLAGRALTVNYNGNNTVITLKFKQEPGIVAETLTESQISALEGKKCNVFVAYQNDTAIIENGQVPSGDYIDEITGSDWLAVSIMSAIYNVLYSSTTKVPQTDAGMHLLATTIESVCSQGVTNGLLAPGVWESEGFGTLQPGDFLAKGFYVYAPPVATQSAAARAARQSVVFQVAGKLAGAVHSAEVIITLNR